MLEDILFYVGSALFLIILMVLVILDIRKIIKTRKKVEQKQQPENLSDSEVKIENNVRYTTQKELTNKDGEVNITFNNNDVILSINRTYIVGSKNKVAPGKYTMLSVNQEKSSFGLKVNGISATYSHGCDMVFAEGDIICPTTQNIILR